MNPGPEVQQQVYESWDESSSPAVHAKRPLLSVVMLVFNHEEFITEAVASVAAQETDFPVELVIGDDCSTDRSFCVLVELQRKHPALLRLISSRANVGMWRNFERLIRASRGEFIAFCDGDDYWRDRRKLQKQVDYLLRNPRYGAVHTGFATAAFRASSWRLGPGRPPSQVAAPADGRVFSHLLNGNFMQTCTVVARAKLVRDAMMSGLDFTVYPVVDWPLFLHISAQSRIAYLATSTAVYRHVPGSAMNSGSARALSVARSYEPMLGDVFRLFAVDEPLQLEALSRLHVSLLSLALLDGNAEAFDASWSWLSRHRPEALTPLRRRCMPFFAHRRFPGQCLLAFLKLKKRCLEHVRYRRTALQEYA
jgi:glycosyltransferase involved in cell wall biosynthesis